MRSSQQDGSPAAAGQVPAAGSGEGRAVMATATADGVTKARGAGASGGQYLWVVPREVEVDVWRRLAALAAGRVMGMRGEELAQ